jgi:transcriptional regulator with XRE-family HTH domain
LRSFQNRCTLSSMVIGQKLRELRESANLGQGDMEKRTGCVRCYTSRVENGHTVPSVETLEKYARALEVPTYKLFIEGDETPRKPKVSLIESGEPTWGARENERRELSRFARALSRMDKRERAILLGMAKRMAGRKDAK